jgi:hypothetical protein
MGSGSWGFRLRVCRHEAAVTNRRIGVASCRKPVSRKLPFASAMVTAPGTDSPNGSDGGKAPYAIQFTRGEAERIRP